MAIFSDGSAVSNLKVDTANFDSLHGPNSGDLGTGFASTTFGSGSISTVELDNVSVTNTGNGGNLQDITGLTINGFTGTGGNTGNTGGLALLISHGSGFQLSNFSFSGYRTGISLFSNGTGNTIDGSTQGILKDIGTLSTNGSSGLDVISSTLSVNNLTLSGIGGSGTQDFDIILNNPSTVMLSNVHLDAKNTGGTAVTDVGVLLSGNSGVIAIQSGSNNNTAVNFAPGTVCQVAESGTATVTGTINFTNPAATTCP